MKSVHTLAKHCGANPSRYFSTSPANVTNKSVSVSDFDVIGSSDAPHSPARNSRGRHVSRARVAQAEPRSRRHKRIRAAFPNEPKVLPNPGFRSHAVAKRSQHDSRTAFARHHQTNPTRRDNRTTRSQRTAERTHRGRTPDPVRTAPPNEPNTAAIAASRSDAKRTHRGSRLTVPKHYRTNPTGARKAFARQGQTNPTHRGNRTTRSQRTAERTHRPHTGPGPHRVAKRTQHGSRSGFPQHHQTNPTDPETRVPVRASGRTNRPRKGERARTATPNEPQPAARRSRRTA